MTAPKPEGDEDRGRGRPRLYNDAGEFERKATEYFDAKEAEGKTPTLAGLCYFMGFADKESFTHYETYGEDFSRTVKRAKLRMEADRHEKLIGKESFTPGVIFDLKNNHGWKDKVEQELSGPDGGPIPYRRIERRVVDPRSSDT